ncbi:hypothetical protein TrVE_jg2531 [Triparma verrucosa]|nr:hypothetical protein TrVE_jg2531 [Triparma verrucosa]
MLELEHVIGYTGHYWETLQAHPVDPTVYVKSMGSVVAICDTSDPHNQQFLRAHDMEISAMSISPSGNMIASGQVGTVHQPGYHAPVIVWDYATKKDLFVLTGHTKQVRLLEFSPDERFLAGTGDDCLLYIWDMQTGEVVFGKKFDEPVILFEWASIRENGRRASYEIILCSPGGGPQDDVRHCELAYDPVRAQWTLHAQNVNMPSGGLSRTYFSAMLSPDNEYMLCGTSVGDMLVFNLKNSVYRASVPVCSSGLVSIEVNAETGDVFCGGGDGTLKKLQGRDMRWELHGETMLDSKIVSLSIMAGNTEMLAATAKGTQYRVLLDDLSATIISTSHTEHITCTSFGSRFDVFATGDKKGNIKVWDLSDYATIMEVNEKKTGGVTCLAWINSTAIVAGFEDSFVRCFDATSGKKLWEIPSAHKGKITCVSVHSDSRLAFLVTGGLDGGVRVWALKNRELMIQFVEHQKSVTGITVDVKKPNLIHSVSSDCTFLTFDLIKEKRVVSHMVREGAFLCCSQRLDSEQEVITADGNGRLLFWDCDYATPVQMVQDPARSKCNAVKVSPSGRYVATCGEDHLVKVFDLVDGGQLASVGHGHSEYVLGLEWSGDEKQIVSVGEDACVCIWNFYGADVGVGAVE